jgi:uncharacterized membrane protein
MAASAGPAGVGSMPNPNAAPPVATTGGLEPHIAAALCYTPFAIGLIASILFLLIAPFNQTKFVRFNAFQSLFLHLGMFLASIALGIVATIITLVLHFLGFLLVLIWPLLWLGILLLLLFMMYKAFNNETLKLPLIGDLAQKQA